MIKKVITTLLLLVFCAGISYAHTKNFNKELQEKNAQVLNDTANMNKRERRRALEKQRFEYQKEIRDKEEELFFINKQKSTMNPHEKREQVNKIKRELKDLQSAQRNLR